LSAGTVYYYWLSAYNGLGPTYAPRVLYASTWGTGVDPEAPSYVDATTPSPTQVQLTWTDNTGNETGFNVRRFNGSSWPTIASVGANQTGYTDSGVGAGSLQFYWLSAVGPGYEKFAPVPLTAMTQGVWPAFPTLNWARGVSSTQVQIGWSDNSNNESGFLIFRFTGSAWVQVGSVGANVTTFTDTGLSPGTTYYYWVWAQTASATAWAPRVVYGTTY
jgi:hypothetical protein